MIGGVVRRVGAVAGCAALLVAGATGLEAAAGPAAAEAAGATSILIERKPARALRRQGVRVIAIRPGVRRRGVRRVRLPVESGQVGAIARLRHAGEIRLRARARGRARTVRVRGVRATLSAASAHLTARVGGRQLTLARLRDVGEVPFNPVTGEVAVPTARLRLTGSARRELRARLGVRSVPAAVGRASIDAAVDVEPPQRVGPEPLARPAGAVDVESASIRWRVRESFVCYIHAQGGPGASASAGAVAEPPAAYPPPNLSAPCSGSPQAPLTYTYAFPSESFAEGWYDPDSGQAAIHANGTVNFAKDVFGIDIDVREPEVELAGPDSRLVQTYADNAAQPVEPQRAVTADLDPVEPDVEAEPGGDLLYSYERVPGIVPDGSTASVLAGFYLPGQPFGWLSVTFTVPGDEAP